MKRTYDELIADRIRELLMDQKKVEEKAMFSGLCFMVDEKMCICVNQQDLLCRIGAEQMEQELEKGACRQMTMNGRASKDFAYVDLIEIREQKSLSYWVDLCLRYNPIAKASKKKS